MGMADKVGFVDGMRTITVVEMWDNGDSGDRDTGRWIRRLRRHPVEIPTPWTWTRTITPSCKGGYHSEDRIGYKYQ